MRDFLSDGRTPFESTQFSFLNFAQSSQTIYPSQATAIQESTPYTSLQRVHCPFRQFSASVALSTSSRHRVAVMFLVEAVMSTLASAQFEIPVARSPSVENCV